MAYQYIYLRIQTGDKMKKRRCYTLHKITFSKYKDGLWRMWGINVTWPTYKAIVKHIRNIYGH